LDTLSAPLNKSLSSEQELGKPMFWSIHWKESYPVNGVIQIYPPFEQTRLIFALIKLPSQTVTSQ